MRILNFRLFELHSVEKITVPKIKEDCSDILLEMEDDGFDIRFNLSENHLHIDIIHYIRDFTWDDISEYVERVLNYCELNNIRVSINGRMGLSTSSYKYFEFKNGKDILDYNDTVRWPSKLFIDIITFELYTNNYK